MGSPSYCSVIVLGLSLYIQTSLLHAADSPAPGAGDPAAVARLLDNFEDPSGWRAYPADGVELRLSSDSGIHGRSLRLDFDFKKGGGYAVAQKRLPIDLPENYALRFKIRGDAPTNHLEFKLIDASGDNVWWSVRRDAQFPTDWETWSIKKRQISFAWGPVGGGEIHHAEALEFAITAGSGGKGTVWLDDLELHPLAAPSAELARPVPSASSAADGHGGLQVLDGHAESWWEPRPDDPRPRIELDLGELREFGGLSIDWTGPRDSSRPLGCSYDVALSEDGVTWRPVYAVRGGNGGRDDLFLPESEARHIRVELSDSGTTGAEVKPGIREIVLQPLAWSETRNSFYQALAKPVRRGLYPRGFVGEYSYWTVVGVDGDPCEALLSTDGALETGIGAFAIEPFISHRNRLLTWADVEISHALEAGHLPIPTVTWRSAELELRITAFAIGERGASSVIVRYRVTNRSTSRTQAELYLAARPFQVNPPSQFLNTRGGWAAIRSLSREGRRLRVNGSHWLESVSKPDDFGACAFDSGDLVVDHLERGEFPVAGLIEDPRESASGAFRYALELPPGEAREVVLQVPLYETTGSVAPEGADPVAWATAQQEACAAEWRERLDRVGIDLPRSAQPLAHSIKAQLAYVLINRAGPAIQPGSRSYARSWIRDGSLTSSALLRLGQNEPVREFIEWFAPNQYANGKIPCCVDRRGADPVPENDSGGQFIFLLAEYHRYTRDDAFAERYWPQALRAADFLDSLRQTLRTEEYRRPEKEHFFGLLPPSISHEGYSAKPMHSYWDDLFALRGFKDAVYLARVLGHDAEAARLDVVRAEFESDLIASIDATLVKHTIDYIPGCADLGDFDATSTTIALTPVQAEGILPRAALLRTFERYYEFFAARRDGADWEAFTPYEIRNIGAFVHLGWRERAEEALAYFLSQQLPPGWRQWTEVVYNAPHPPRFLGDLPHTWVGSDFVRAGLDLFAHDRERDEALIIAAGVPRIWLEEDAGGVGLRDLPTPYGSMSYTLRKVDGTIELALDGKSAVPAGGFILRPPVSEAATAILDGHPLARNEAGEWVVRSVPATIRFQEGR
ncbi:MAG: discoidin domain-containing protein [Candidatus Eisenbacteria bacterium]|nr:discoidin domain-containing protein [Candidatus Eisenbacteria bacterium]